MLEFQYTCEALEQAWIAPVAARIAIRPADQSLRPRYILSHL
jgi:hypothetical protein